MVTTIQIGEETQRKLLQIMAEIQSETGRKISYDEALNVLIRRTERTQRARRQFLKLFGSLLGGERNLDELAEFKRSEKERLEKKHF